RAGGPSRVEPLAVHPRDKAVALTLGRGSLGGGIELRERALGRRVGACLRLERDETPLERGDRFVLRSGRREAVGRSRRRGTGIGDYLFVMRRSSFAGKREARIETYADARRARGQPTEHLEQVVSHGPPSVHVVAHHRRDGREGG